MKFTTVTTAKGGQERVPSQVVAAGSTERYLELKEANATSASTDEKLSIAMSVLMDLMDEQGAKLQKLKANFDSFFSKGNLSREDLDRLGDLLIQLGAAMTQAGTVSATMANTAANYFEVTAADKERSDALHNRMELYEGLVENGVARAQGLFDVTAIRAGEAEDRLKEVMVKLIPLEERVNGLETSTRQMGTDIREFVEREVTRQQSRDVVAAEVDRVLTELVATGAIAVVKPS